MKSFGEAMAKVINDAIQSGTLGKDPNIKAIDKLQKKVGFVHLIQFFASSNAVVVQVPVTGVQALTQNPVAPISKIHVYHPIRK